MKVEIWSDIVCPFCYIGKRHFEKALETFAHKDEVEIEWRSFQLDPAMKYEAGKTIHQVLAEKKGWTVEKAKQMSYGITQAANELGLEYNFEITVPANTFNAHRVTKLAADFALQDEMEEGLFRAYFTEGKNINDIPTLFKLGKEVGLPESNLKETLETEAYSKDVIQDMHHARELGIQGVPFFLIDQKYAVSGAQPTELFMEALNTAWKESDQSKKAKVSASTEADSCTIDGNC